MSMCFKSTTEFWVFPMIFIFWIAIYIIDYRYNQRYKTYKNFLFYMFADENFPFTNFTHSVITFGFLIWIIRLIYTLIYGMR